MAGMFWRTLSRSIDAAKLRESFGLPEVSHQNRLSHVDYHETYTLELAAIAAR